MDKYSSVTANRYRAAQLGLTEHFTDSEWESLLSMYKNCPCCGNSFDDVRPTADHVLPLVRGGGNAIDNIQPLCGKCNARKHDKHIDYRHGTPVHYPLPKLSYNHKRYTPPPSPPRIRERYVPPTKTIVVFDDLSDEAIRLLDLLSQKMGISKASVIEIVVRDEAKREAIPPEPTTHQEPAPHA